MPFRGCYVILTPEYRQLGCLPANQFIPALMEHLEEHYYAGGLDNIATVLTELAESLDARVLSSIAKLSPLAWSQRLGYLLERLGEAGLAEGLAEYIERLKPVPVPLSVSQPHKGVRQIARWRLFPNETIDSEA